MADATLLKKLGDDYAVGTANDIASRAEAFGMRVWRADGCDFFAVYETMRELLEYVRAGNGPAAVEFDTERFYGHFEGDAQTYRGSDEVKNLRADQDCLVRFSKFVTESGDVAESDLAAIDQEVLELIEGAVALKMNSRPSLLKIPTVASACADVPGPLPS